MTAAALPLPVLLLFLLAEDFGEAAARFAASGAIAFRYGLGAMVDRVLAALDLTCLPTPTLWTRASSLHCPARAHTATLHAEALALH